MSQDIVFLRTVLNKCLSKPPKKSCLYLIFITRLHCFRLRLLNEFRQVTATATKPGHCCSLNRAAQTMGEFWITYKDKSYPLFLNHELLIKLPTKTFLFRFSCKL